MNLNYAVFLEKTGLQLSDDEKQIIEVTHRENLSIGDLNSLQRFIYECDYEKINWYRVEIALSNIKKQLKEVSK